MVMAMNVTTTTAMEDITTLLLCHTPTPSVKLLPDSVTLTLQLQVWANIRLFYLFFALFFELALSLWITNITNCIPASIAESNDKVGAVTATGEKIEYSAYSGEHQINDIMALIDKDLSEPYSIYTYRYFINNWPKLCIVVSNILDMIIFVIAKFNIFL